MKNWTIEIVLRNDKGEVKFSEVLDAPKESKTICLALEGKDSNGKQKQVRPSCLEFKAKQLFEGFQDEEKTIPCKLNGVKSGFFVDTTIRFADYEKYKASLDAPKKAKEETESSVEM